MIGSIDVFLHSSIRIRGSRTIYIDPFRIGEEFHDADYIFITHDHYDHFSPEDIAKAAKSDTVFVAPEPMGDQVRGILTAQQTYEPVGTQDKKDFGTFQAETVPAYNRTEKYHPKEAGWVGYIFTIEDERIYVAGDTDMTEENRRIKCDIALVPVGGIYTMSAVQAAELVNAIRPKIAVPIHYGSIVGNYEDPYVFKKFVKEPTIVVVKIPPE